MAAAEGSEEAATVEAAAFWISVAESASEIGGVVVFGPTKNHQRRVVVLPRLLVDPLAAYIEARTPMTLCSRPPVVGCCVIRTSGTGF